MNNICLSLLISIIKSHTYEIFKNGEILFIGGAIFKRITLKNKGEQIENMSQFHKYISFKWYNSPYGL